MEHGGRYKGFNKTSSDEVLRAGEMLLDELGRNDKVAVWQYADTPQKIADFTTAHDKLDQLFLNSEVPDSSETNFYDALVSTARTMKDVTGRKALIVITSGIDTFSKAKYADALEEVRTSGTPVYIINLGSDLRQAATKYATTGQYEHLDWKKIDGRLQEIANASGGRMYAPASVLDLAGLYDDLMENLRIRYVINYRSSTRSPVDAPRTVRVELIDPTTNEPLQIVSMVCSAQCEAQTVTL